MRRARPETATATSGSASRVDYPTQVPIQRQPPFSSGAAIARVGDRLGSVRPKLAIAIIVAAFVVPAHDRRVSASGAAGPAPRGVAVALDDALAFREPAQCVAGPALEQFFADLDGRSDAKNVRPDPKLGSVPFAASTSRRTDGREVLTVIVSAHPLRPTSWHGLRLQRISTMSRQIPESDSTYARTIALAEHPATVLRTLNRLGFATRMAPGHSRLSSAGDECGGAMQVMAVAGGAALHCDWGC